MWIRLKILSQEITGLNSFVILSLQPVCKHGERWTLRFDGYWDHQVGKKKDKEIKPRTHSVNNEKLYDQGVILKSLF